MRTRSPPGATCTISVSLSSPTPAEVQLAAVGSELAHSPSGVVVHEACRGPAVDGDRRHPAGVVVREVASEPDAALGSRSARRRRTRRPRCRRRAARSRQAGRRRRSRYTVASGPSTRRPATSNSASGLGMTAPPATSSRTPTMRPVGSRSMIVRTPLGCVIAVAHPSPSRSISVVPDVSTMAVIRSSSSQRNCDDHPDGFDASARRPAAS